MSASILTGYFLMEESLNYLREAVQSLNWGKDEDECSEDEETTIAKRLESKPWYRKSRKSIVRLMGSSIFMHGNERGRRKFKSRSLVRMIASKLPLKPTKRAYFEIFTESKRAVMSKAKGFFEDNISSVKSQMPEMGLADIGLFTWTDFEEENSANTSGIIVRTTLDSSGLSIGDISTASTDEVTVPPRCLRKGKKLREKGSSAKKISALEDELANLRAQIAMIVSLQEKAQEPSVPTAAPPPPPPPPIVPTTPLPPPVVPKIQIKFNKKKTVMETNANENGVPSMSHVLAGLSAVKLKSANVKRSPGGTPLKMRSLNQNANSQDPADVIANALRKKFAMARKSIGSPSKDKENQWSPVSEFSPSPIKNADLVPVTSSPEFGCKARRKSNTIPGRRIVLSPVSEN